MPDLAAAVKCLADGESVLGSHAYSAFDPPKWGWQGKSWGVRQKAVY
jgi:hypothetical protein